ncbi:MAG: hypothetical protein R3E82_13820 [Pseudomonadales bacterium]|nr:hypothetical protein [Pseudomonadales bacterium]
MDRRKDRQTIKAGVALLAGRIIITIRITLVSTLLITSGCSSRGWFNFGRELGESKADCAALVSVSERRRCEESFDLDYERYEKEKARIEARDTQPD